MEEKRSVVHEMKDVDCNAKAEARTWAFLEERVLFRAGNCYGEKQTMGDIAKETMQERGEETSVLERNKERECVWM